MTKGSSSAAALAPRSFWGATIQRDLALLAPLLAMAGCSPPPPAVSPQPPPSAPPVIKAPPEVQPVKDEEGAAVGVGALKELAARGEGNFGYNFVYRGVPSGVGLFSFYEFEREGSFDGAPACSIKTSNPEVCEGFSVAPWKEAPSWPAAWLPNRYEDRVGDDGKMFASPARWQRFSPGKEGVFACREHNAWAQEPEPLVVDFLRPDGKVETFLKDTSGRFSDAEIVEVSGGHLGIFRLTPVAADGRMYRSVGELVAAPVVSSGKERQIGALQKLQIGDVWFDGRAADARDARKMHKRANYGPFRAVALLDAKGKQTGEVALVWVEAFPPPGFEEKEEQRRKEERPSKGTKKAKHQCGRPSSTEFYDRMTRRRPFQGDGCGGRASRLLSSSDVKKILHITRLNAGGKQKDDRAFDLPASYEPEKYPIVAVAQPGGGLSVNQMNFDGQFHRGKDTPEPSSLGTPVEPDAPPVNRIYATIAPPALTGAPPQRLLSAAFDPRSGEGILLYGEAVQHGYGVSLAADVILARRVSALGEPVGEAVLLPELREQTNMPVMGRGKDGWLVLSDAPMEFRVVGGVHDGATHPIHAPKCEQSYCSTSLKALLPAPGGRLDLLFTFGSVHGELMQENIDGSTLLSGEPTPMGKVDPSRVLIDNQGAFRDDSGKPRFWHIGEDNNPVLGGSEPREDAGSKEGRRTVHQVWGDLVIVTRTKKDARATWLKAGQTVELDPKQAEESDSEGVRVRGDSPNGPLLPGGKWLLPATPGPLIETSRELKDAVKLCPIALPTGPRRLLLACSEAPDDQRPMVRVGTRVVRY